MSLLHNAKKHFILAIVFVLAISALNAAILLENKAWARTYIDEERSALAKIIVGRMYGCISGYTASDKNYLGNTGYSSDPSNKKAILEGKYPTNLNRITSSIYNNKEIENIAAWVIAKLAGTKVESDSGWVQCTTGSVFKWSLNALKFLNDGGTYNAGYWDSVRLDFLKPQFEFYYKAQGGNLVGNKISDEDLQSYYANDEVSMRVNVNFETLSNWLKTEFPNLDLFGAPSNAEKYWIAWHTADGYMTENEGFTCSNDEGFDLTYAQNSGYVTQRTINPNTGEEEDCYVPSYKHDTLDYTAYYAKTNGDIVKVPDISDHDGDDIANDLNSYVQAAKSAITERKSQQLKDEFKTRSETYKQDCVNKYNTWKDSWKKSIYPEFYNQDILGEYFRENTKKKQLLDAFNEAVDNYESAHPIIYYEDLDLQSYNTLSADRDITFTFGVRVYVVKRGELDNRCFIDAFEDAIETNYKKKEKEILEKIAAEENKEKAKNLKTACTEMFEKWLDAAYEANGLNMQEWHQGSGYGYSQEIMAKRNELVKTVTSSFGAAATSRIDWTSYVYREPGASYEIPHYDENGNYLSGQIEKGTADKDVGVCKACAYIDNASKTLKRKGYAVPEIGEGTSCTNPTVEASHPDNIWATPSIERDDDDIPPDLLTPIDFQLGITGDDMGYQGGNYKPDSCYSNSASLGWIVCPLVSAASAIGETMWNHIETYHLKLPANALFGYTQGKSDSGVHIAWGLIRNIANLAFIVIFLVIIVSQVSGFGINNYGIKKMLPKLIVCVLLVNLSFIICQIAVDLSNTIGSAIGNFLSDIAAKIPWNIEGYAQSDGTGGVSTFINIALIGGAAGGLITLIMSMNHGDGIGSLVGALGLFVLGIVIVIVVAIATLYITLIIREAAIVICITIAPLAIVCNVLPNTEPLFKKWLSLMKALLVLYPVSSFVIGGGHLAASVLASTGINTMKLAGSVVEVIPYFFIPSLLRKSLAGIGNVGARLGALGKGMGRKVSNGAKNGIRNSKRYQEMLAGSKFKAEGRYNASKYKRNTRRQQRLEAERDENGGTLSRPKTEQLNKLMEENRKYNAAQKDAKTNTQAGMYAAMIARDDANREANTITTALTYGGAQTDNKGNIIRDKNGNIVFDQKRGEEYTAGVMFNKTLNARKDADDNINHARHAENLFQAGVKKSAIDRDIQTRTAEAFVMDYDEQGRPVYDKNGNVIEDVVMDPATGKPVIDPTTGKPQTKPRKATYTGKAYTENYRQSQESKLNSTLASGYVPRQKTTLSGAIESAQNTASNEIGKQAEADYTEKQKSELDKIAESTVNNIATNYRDPGIIESAEALIRVQSARGQEDKAINTFKGINKNLQLEYDKTESAAKVARDAGRIEEADALDAKCAEIQKCADSFNQKMASSPIKLVSMMAKQIEGTSMSSDTTAHLDANGNTTANGANYDLDKYIQSAMFKNYTDQKGASLVFDKDSNKYLAQAAKGDAQNGIAGININIDTKHIIEQMSAANQPESSINSLKTVLEEKINAAKVAAPAGSTPAPVFSENLSSDVLTKLNAATIEVMTTSAGDLDNMKRMLGSMTLEQRGKLTDAQISAYQKIDSTFMAGSNNGGSNNGGGNKGNSGFNYSEEGGFGADDAAY